MRFHSLPRLGVGISAEFESYRKGIDAPSFAAEYPGLVHFLEYGGDLQRGLDDQTQRWKDSSRPATYHFLDLNLEEPDDLDAGWLRDTLSLAKELGAAWLCGDAGLWHFGPRDRGHQTLLPPVLCRESALLVAESVARLEDQSGMACLPENPPGALYLGPLHLLDFFALVSERAQCGLLLDLAHLTLFQRLRGLPPLTALDGFPLDRVVELHVAGGVERSVQGFSFVEDLHAPEPLPETWQLLEYVLPRAPNLRAIVYECEMNQPAEVLENFARLNRLFPAPGREAATPAPAASVLRVSREPGALSSANSTSQTAPKPEAARQPSQAVRSPELASPPRADSGSSLFQAETGEGAISPASPRRLQRLLVRAMYDPERLPSLSAEGPEADCLREIDPRALLVDPLRRRKTLRPLAEELRVSSSLALHERRSLAWLESGFFASPAFHEAISNDQPLVLALSAFLRAACEAGELVSPVLPEVLRYEESQARARRIAWSPPGEPRLSEGALVQRAPGVFGLVFSYDVIAAVQAVEHYLFELSLMPQSALCDDAPRPVFSAEASGPRYLVISPSASGPALSNGDAALCALLQATEAARPLRDLAPLLAPFGIPARNLAPLVDSLARDGLLCVTPEPPRAVSVSPLRLPARKKR